MISRTVFGDLAFAWRLWRNAAALSVVAVLCLALAIGLATAAFTVVHGAFLSPLPVPNGDRIVTAQDYHRTGGYDVRATAAQFSDRRRQATTFEALGAFYSRSVTIDASQIDGAAVTRAAYVSANAFDVLGVRPAIGRGPSDADLAAGMQTVTVLSHALWRDGFGSDPAIIGRTVRIAGTPHVVIGVMGAGFAFPFREQLWIPVQTDDALPGATREALSVIGRLQPGASRRQAAAELSALGQGRAATPSDATTTVVMPFTRGFMSPDEEWAMYAFVLALLGFLAITAANLANLFFARNAARVREIAIRSALGAGRGRLVRQLLLESLLLGSAGAAAGILVARACLLWFQSQVPDIPWWADFGLSWAVLGFVVFAGLLATAIAGIGPAVRLTRSPLATTLHGTGPALSGLRFSKSGAALLVAQIAVSVGFLSVVGVLAQSLLGFAFQRDQVDSRQVLVAQVYLGPPDEASLSRPGVGRREVWRQHYARSVEHIDAIRQELTAEPGVAHVTMATHFPGNDRQALRIQLPLPDGAAGAPVSTRVAEIGPHFFETLGVPLRTGRDFSQAERRDPPRAVIVNEPFARKYFPGVSPLGQVLRVAVQGDNAPGPWLEIVGVAEDLGLNPGDSSRADGIYLPFAPSNFVRFGVRTHGEPTDLVPRLHDVVRQQHPAAQVQAVESLEALMDGAEAVFRGLGTGLLAIGGMSLLLSAMSLYLLVSFGVTRRTREIGIRVALGASRAAILRAVLRRELTIAVAGGAAGLGLGFALYRLVAEVPFDLHPAGPALLLLLLAVVVLVGAAACLGPVRRALAVDPATSMRQE